MDAKMIQKCENCKENGNILIKNAGKSKFQKHACQNTVAMETSNCLDQNMSYQERIILS